MKNSISGLQLFLIMILGLLMIISMTGCGKKGRPSVPGENRQFSFTDLKADMQNNCLVIHANLSGSWWNVDQIYMEIQPSNIGDNCDTCPFLPTEQAVFDSREIFLERGNGKIGFQFCPVMTTPEIHAWRWRLIGRNIVRDLPYVLTPVMTIQNNSN